jgi:DNA-binding NarL/FixJ family response regulator
MVGVVICDDEADLRELTRFGLELDRRLQVLGEAESAEECIEVVRELSPDAIVLDLGLPGMDGLDAIPLLRGVSPAVSIVVLSGMDAARMERPALERGADAYVQKGTPLAQIRSTVLSTVRDRRDDSADSIESPDSDRGRSDTN